MVIDSWISIVIILTFSWLLDCIDVYRIVGAHAIIGFMALGIRFFHALVSICWIAQSTWNRMVTGHLLCCFSGRPLPSHRLQCRVCWHSISQPHDHVQNFVTTGPLSRVTIDSHRLTTLKNRVGKSALSENECKNTAKATLRAQLSIQKHVFFPKAPAKGAVLQEGLLS